MKKVALIFSCVLVMSFFSGCTENPPDTFATLYGIITDHETDGGEPIPNASITLSPGGRTQTSGTDGRFEFKNLDPMQYTVTVQKAGYQTNRKTITAIAGEVSEVNIPLTKNK